MVTTEHPLVEALYRVEGKAEIINGKIVRFMPTGSDPNHAAFEIAVSLRAYARQAQHGRVGTDNLGFIVDLPHRTSFAPDAAYYVRPPSGMKFVEGAPQFAVDVRSENDHGPAAKRADYFAAGTLVVWDVDTQSEEVVRVFRDGNAEQPAAVFHRGDTADAEPAVPGWTIPIDDLFAPAA